MKVALAASSSFRKLSIPAKSIVLPGCILKSLQNAAFLSSVLLDVILQNPNHGALWLLDMKSNIDLSSHFASLAFFAILDFLNHLDVRIINLLVVKIY